jgi:hypothetical protein
VISELRAIVGDKVPIAVGVNGSRITLRRSHARQGRSSQRPRAPATAMAVRRRSILWKDLRGFQLSLRRGRRRR